MFTGIIEEVGRVIRVAQRKGTRGLTVSCVRLAKELRKGDSMAVSGVCLTAVEIRPESVGFDLAEETWKRTSFSRIKPGALVNLELPMRPDGRFGGHIVQGHVDGVGKLLDLKKIEDREDWRLTISLPPKLMKYVVPQGSITIEGISLTVAAVHAGKVEVAIIPHTYEATSLRTLAPGSPVNIETDVLAKYAEKMAGRKAASGLTVAGLMKLGF